MTAASDAGRVVAYCQPNDPTSSSAFSWPGTARNPKHTMELVPAATLSALQRRLDAASQERAHLLAVNDHLIKVLSAIHMRCAPPDTVLDDGRTMRFVPPDPEFYWRELSGKIKAIEEEIKFDPCAILAADGDNNGETK